MRPLLNTIKANEEGRVSDHTVAKMFAALNAQAHRDTADRTVGPRSIVLWRRRLESSLGGGYEFFDGTNRDTSDNNGLTIPQITKGMDVGGLVAAMAEITIPWMDEWMDAQDEDLSAEPPRPLNTLKLDEAISSVDHLPNEALE